MGNPVIKGGTSPLPPIQTPPPAPRPADQPVQTAPPAPSAPTINTTDQSSARAPGAPSPMQGSPASLSFPGRGEQADATEQAGPPRPQSATSVSGYGDLVFSRNQAARPTTPGGARGADTGETTARFGGRRETVESQVATDQQGGYINRDRFNADASVSQRVDGGGSQQVSIGYSFSRTEGTAGSQAAITELDRNAQRPEQRRP